MGKVFEGQREYNKHTGRYSWDNWNEAWERHSHNPREMKVLTHLVAGNFARFMIELLEFKYKEEENKWVPKRKLTKT